MCYWWSKRPALLGPLIVVAFSLAPAARAADVVKLNSGEELRGQVVERSADAVTVEHPVLGRLVVPAAQVVSVTPGPTTAPTTAPVAVAEAPVVVPEPAPPKVGNGSPGWFGSSFMRGWEKRFELGFNGSSGTSQTFDLITKFNGKFEDDKHRWKTSAAYYRGSANGNRSRNEFVAQFEKDWLLPQSKWFWFARGRYDYNEFQYWRQRAGGFGGVGYEFAKGPKFDLIGRVGLGASRDFGGDDPKSRPEGLLGVEARWAITDRVTLTGFTTFFPDLTDPRHFRNMSGAGAALTFAVDPSGGMSFKLGVENEYQSFTRDDSPHNALRYFGALVYVF